MRARWRPVRDLHGARANTGLTAVARRAASGCHRSRSHTGRERVLPAEPAEAGEVAVGTAKDEAVLECERGEVAVGNEFRAPGGVGDERSQDLGVKVSRGRDPRRLEREPGLHLAPCRTNRDGTLEDPRVGNQPYEGEKRWPGESHACLAAQLLVEPRPRPLVLGLGGHAGVDEKVRVDEDQRWSSPSAMARASAMSSMLARRQRPRSMGGVR